MIRLHNVCVYNHKEWAKDFEGFQTKLFPEVKMEEPPNRVDPLGDDVKHNYPKLK